MFGRKASFEFGTKSILCLFLAFAFYGKASAAIHEEFGCQFADKEYRIQRTNKEKPVYGNVSTLEPTSLTTDKKDIFVNIAEPLQKILFSETNIMNDVSLFTQFVKDYKNSSNQNTLESFFNNYEIPFKPKEYYATQSRDVLRKTYDPASYLIQEFHDLNVYLRGNKKHFSPYLVSAYVDPIGISYFSPEVVSAEIPNLIQKPVQDHIAGIIKLKAGGRKGYILMDPGYANGVKLYHPFIVYVMEDGEPPHGEFISNPMNGKLFVSTGGEKGSSYILVTHTKAQSKTNHVLYYVDMSYCSFMENTVKANIMRFNHGIVGRTTNGTKLVHLTFKMSSSTDKTNITNSMKDAFALTDLTNELKYIQTNVIENPQMMSDLKNIAKKLDLNWGGERQEPVEPGKSRSEMESLLKAKYYKEWSIVD